VSISIDRWQLWEREGRRLIANRLLEDLLMMWGYEYSDTLIGREVQRGRVQLPHAAALELERFRELYPEWLHLSYLSIPRETRRQRLAIVFGDLPLAVEPSLQEIPGDIYQRLVLAKLCGGPAIVPGANATHLLVVKLLGTLPLEHQKKLICEYLDLLYKNESRMVSRSFTAKAGISHKRRYELELLGRYRKLEDNGFDMGRALEAAHQDRPCSPRVYRASRRFVESLMPRRWEIFEQLLCPVQNSIRDPLE
jgi:hypothetical protein